MNACRLLGSVLLFLLTLTMQGQVAAQEQSPLRLTVLPERGTLAESGAVNITVLVENTSAAPLAVTRLDLLPTGLQPTLLPTATPPTPLPPGTLFIVAQFSTVVRDYTVQLSGEGTHLIAAHLSYLVGAETRLVAANSTVAVAAPAPVTPLWQNPIVLQLIGALLALLGGFGATLFGSSISDAMQRRQQAQRARSLLEAWLYAYQAKIKVGAAAPPDVYAEVVLKEGLLGALASQVASTHRETFGSNLGELYAELLDYAGNPSKYSDNQQLRAALQAKLTGFLSELKDIS